MEPIMDIQRRVYRTLPILVLTVLVSACANLNSIHRSWSPPEDGPHVISIDSKQRVVLSNPVKEGKNPDIVRFCTEPPPDVFTALASSLGAEASLTKSASKDVATKLAATISENTATIERTQTMSILRDTMYRNCERYLSGAISEDEFIVQASRDQQLIVQVLAVEQITGVAKAQSTALTTVAKAAVGGTSDTSLTAIADSKKNVDAKRADRIKTAAEAKALPPSGPCGDTPVDEASPPSGVTAEQAKAKNAKCAEVAEAVKSLREAEEYYALIKETAAKQGSVNSETRGKLTAAVLAASEASAKIAEKVVEIVRQYQAFDEIGMSCVVMLRKMRKKGDLPPFCTSLLHQMANTRAAQFKNEAQRLNEVHRKLLLKSTDGGAIDK